MDRPAQRYLTTDQAAEYLGQKPRTLQDWRCDKIGPPFVVLGPRNIKYDIRDLDAWVDERRFTPAVRGLEGRRIVTLAESKGRLR
jgi:predicted DNA-binding transcriptional regulator AlpA